MQKAHGGQAGRQWANRSMLQGGKSSVPIKTTVGVFTTKPADEIAIDKVEVQQGGCVKKTTGGT